MTYPSGYFYFNTPSREEPDFMNKLDQGYIGLNKPKVQRSYEPDPDPHYWQRRKQARELGVDEELLADEPDRMAEDEQGWD